MNLTRFVCLYFALPLTLAWAGETEKFVPLYNGRDLTGWTNVNCAPETWQVRDGVIACTGRPTGALRTARQYENFIFEVEWRHLTSGGNAGIFIWASPVAAPGVPFLRAVEVQVLDHGFNVKGKNEWYTTHGDVFPIHGTTMDPLGRHNGARSFPSEERAKPSPEWNHYRIVCTNGSLRLHVNGKEVSGGDNCNYRKGYLGLESEGAPTEFRNLRILELPASGAGPEVTAPEGAGWQPLFNGLDWRGWRTNAATAKQWSIAGERLVLKAGGTNAAAILWAEPTEDWGELIVDCRQLPGTAKEAAPVLRWGRGESGWEKLPLTGVTGHYQRFTVRIENRVMTVRREGQEIQRLKLPPVSHARERLGLEGAGGSWEFMNLYGKGE